MLMLLLAQLPLLPATVRLLQQLQLTGEHVAIELWCSWLLVGRNTTPGTSGCTLLCHILLHRPAIPGQPS
jgi:hypothetical protein